ncbi:MAG TPA: hypothetical protein ENK31_01705, partial [Nannocystis exedens]|nr:hypothetical protein [Nannocystis exedens]
MFFRVLRVAAIAVLSGVTATARAAPSVEDPSVEPAASSDLDVEKGVGQPEELSDPTGPAESEDPSESSESSESNHGEPAEDRRTVVAHHLRSEHRGRASSVVRRRDIEERLPRSAPDALRYEPGVYVQQTAHSQGSPYV